MPGAEAADDVDAEDDPRDLHARDPRRLAVAADGDDVAAVARAVEQDPGAHGDGQEDEHRRRDADDLAGAEPAHALEVEDRDRRLVAHPQRQPSRHREHRERGDERNDLPVRDQARVDAAEQDAHAERPEQEREASRVGELATGDRGGGHHRADRQVDAGGGDHERHADRQHADHRALAQDVEDVVRGREHVRLEDRAGDQQQDHDADERVLLQLEGAVGQAEREPPAGGGVGDGGHRISSGTDSGWVTAWRSSSNSVASSPGTSATSSPSRMTRMRVHRPISSGSSDETTTTALAGLREVGDQAIDLGLRADVDAAGRLVEQQHLAVAHQPAREHDLLLVAARQLAGERARVVRLGLQLAQQLARRLALGSRAEQPAAPVARRRRPA